MLVRARLSGIPIARRMLHCHLLSGSLPCDAFQSLTLACSVSLLRLACEFHAGMQEWRVSATIRNQSQCVLGWVVSALRTNRPCLFPGRLVLRGASLSASSDTAVVRACDCVHAQFSTLSFCAQICSSTELAETLPPQRVCARCVFFPAAPFMVCPLCQVVALSVSLSSRCLPVLASSSAATASAAFAPVRLSLQVQVRVHTNDSVV